MGDGELLTRCLMTSWSIISCTASPNERHVVIEIVLAGNRKCASQRGSSPYTFSILQASHHRRLKHEMWYTHVSLQSWKKVWRSHILNPTLRSSNSCFVFDLTLLTEKVESTAHLLCALWRLFETLNRKILWVLVEHRIHANVPNFSIRTLMLFWGLPLSKRTSRDLIRLLLYLEWTSQRNRWC